MPRPSKLPSMLAVLLAGAVGVQVLASCGVWVLLAFTQPDCCPSHKAATTTVIAPTCCAGVSPDINTSTTSRSVAKASGHRFVEWFWVDRPSLDVRTGYPATLPVAARGHTPVRLSAFLI